VFQVGGVMQFAINDIAARVHRVGGDQSGLGRWTWQTLCGKQGRIVRIITAYRPVKNESGIGSTWNQHQYHSDLNNLQGNPHERWITDLSKEIVTWKEAGKSIILMVDLNDNVRSSNTAKALQRLGLHDIITKTHRSNTPTYQRGSTTIDGIFVSSEIVPTQCGYLRSTSDHLCAWMDLDMKLLFEVNSNAETKKIRRLQCTDPRTVSKYNKALWLMVSKAKIPEQIDEIYNNTHLNAKENQVRWEKIDSVLVKFRLAAESKCRKIKAGNIQWSP
jgi:hypothetical protein